MARPPALTSFAATALALVASATGCPGPDNPYLPPPEPDFDTFLLEVEPILDRSCASLGCHGARERRLSIYSVGALRAEPSVAGEPLQEDQLSVAEQVWNYDGLCYRLVDEADAATSRLLLKCVDPALGGIDHANGTVVFDSLDDPDYLAFRDWIETGL